METRYKDNRRKLKKYLLQASILSFLFSLIFHSKDVLKSKL